jgi:hypothetical protein
VTGILRMSLPTTARVIWTISWNRPPS